MIPLDQWRTRASYETLHGRRIAWWTSEKDAGHNDENPWLLLIHGYPTSSWDWTAIWHALTPHFRLVALDMAGFGLSEKPKDTPYKIVHQADLQEALLAHLGIQKAHAFVHDYGVTVGQELLARQLDGALGFDLLSVAFLNGGLFPEQHRARPIQKLGLTPLGPLMGLMLSEKKLRQSLDGVFGPNTKASDEEIKGHWALMKEQDGPAVMHKVLRYIIDRRENRERWVGALKKTTTPIRLIDGGQDPVSGVHLYHYYKEQVPNADAVLFEDIGHYPHTEAPTLTTDAFLDFHRKLGVIAA